ncbi:hypothetical protein HK103_005814 [Boothiomyces macroporosus]|uniref:RING-type domain-containing protein n=1 Tax=Boothiomyces macroporosus TaxID=261099 RepID=A0AAD5Y515_9FUNG|nr:hypothetical protein HK103_005814 [Boothiomyces macroporosus]
MQVEGMEKIQMYQAMLTQVDPCPICLQGYDIWHFYGNLYNEINEHLVERYRNETVLDSRAITDRVQLADCNHIFHYGCLYQLYQKSHVYDCCPLCRKTLINGYGNIMINVWSVDGRKGTMDMMPELMSVATVRRRFLLIFHQMALLTVLSTLIQVWWEINF